MNYEKKKLEARFSVCSDSNVEAVRMRAAIVHIGNYIDILQSFKSIFAEVDPGIAWDGRLMFMFEGGSDEHFLLGRCSQEGYRARCASSDGGYLCRSLSLLPQEDIYYQALLREVGSEKVKGLKLYCSKQRTGRKTKLSYFYVAELGNRVTDIRELL